MQEVQQCCLVQHRTGRLAPTGLVNVHFTELTVSVTGEQVRLLGTHFNSLSVVKLVLLGMFTADVAFYTSGICGPLPTERTALRKEASMCNVLS